MAGGYDLFTQPQGPTVAISLFADAASKGIDAGNAQKTPLQASIDGSIEGIKTGQEIAKNQQDMEAKSLEMQQAPLDAQIKQQQIEMNRAKLSDAARQSELDQMKLETERLLEEDKRAAEIEEAKDRLNKAQRKTEASELLKEADSILKDPNITPEEKAKVFIDPKYLDAWSLDPKKQEQGIRSNSQYYDGNPEDRRTADYLSWGAEKQKQEFELAKLEAEGKGIPENIKKTREKVTKAFGYSINNAYNKYSNEGKVPVEEENFIAMARLELSGEVNEFDKTPLYQLKINNKTYQDKISKSDADAFADAQVAIRNSKPDLYAQAQKYGARDFEAEKAEKNNLNKAKPETGFQQAAKPKAVTQETPKDFMGKPMKDTTGRVDFMGKPMTATPTPKITANTDSPVTEETANIINDKITSLPEDKKKKFEERATLNKSSYNQHGDIDMTMPPREATKVMLETSSDFVRPKEDLPERTKKVSGYQRVIQKVSSNPHLKGQPAIVKAVAAAESGGNINAKSPTGVKGLMQLTRAAAIDARELLGRRLDRNNPKDNAEGGAAYLKEMLRQFPGNTDLGLAAYNGGAGTIKRAMKMTGSTDFDKIIQWLEYDSTQTGSDFTPAKVKEIAAYPTRVKEYLYSFAEDDNPVWLTQI